MSHRNAYEGLVTDLDEVGHDEIPMPTSTNKTPPPLPTANYRHPARDSQVLLSKDEEKLVEDIERNEAILRKMKEDREKAEIENKNKEQRLPPKNGENVPHINNIIKNPSFSAASGPREVHKRASVSRLKKGGMILKPLIVWPVVGALTMAAAPVVLGGAVSLATGMSLLSAAGTIAVYSGPIFSLAGIGIGVAGIAKSYAVFKTPRHMLEKMEEAKVYQALNKKPGLIDRGISATAGIATYAVTKSFQLTLLGIKEGGKLAAKGISKGFVTLEERSRAKKANKQSQAPTIINPNQPKP